jgi:hypothetical protein
MNIQEVILSLHQMQADVELGAGFRLPQESRLDNDKTARVCNLAFQKLVRPRESVLRFGEIRTFMADEPGKAVEELFHRSVKIEDVAEAVSEN